MFLRPSVHRTSILRPTYRLLAPRTPLRHQTLVRQSRVPTVCGVLLGILLRTPLQGPMGYGDLVSFTFHAGRSRRNHVV